MKKISALILIMCLIIFALAACGGSDGGQGGSGNNSSGEQGGTGDGGSDEGGAGEENESGGESGDGGSNESGGESSGEGGSDDNGSGDGGSGEGGSDDNGSGEGGAGEGNESGDESGDGGSNESGGESSGEGGSDDNGSDEGGSDDNGSDEGGSDDNGSGDGGSDDVKPENPNLVTFDEAIDARLSISISSSVGSYSVVDDPADSGRGKVLLVSKSTDKSGSSVSLYPAVKNSDANVTVIETDVLIKNASQLSQLELSLSRSSGDAMSDYLALISFSFSDTKDGSLIYYSDYHNGAGRSQKLDTGARIGEWFTLRIEYWEGDMDTFHYRTYVNGVPVYTSQSIYSKAIASGERALYRAEEICRFGFRMNQGVIADLMFDNMCITQEYIELGGGELDDALGGETLIKNGDTVMINSNTPGDSNKDISSLFSALASIVGGDGRVFYGSVSCEKEIIVGYDGRRAISRLAYEHLERLERESNITEARYVIYASGGKIAIAFDENKYTKAQATHTIIPEFVNNYLQNAEYLLLEEGVVCAGVVDIMAIQEALDEERVALAWESLGASTTPEVYEAFRTYYSMFKDTLVDYIANLYDPGIGCFYSTMSGKLHEGIYPNIEATRQIMSYAQSSGMLNGTSLYNAFPEQIRQQIIYYTKAIQDPNGYFYVPQMGKEAVDNAISRRGRDLSWGLAVLSNMGSAPTYSTVTGTKGDGITADEYWASLNTDAPKPVIPEVWGTDGDRIYYGALTCNLISDNVVAAVSKAVMAASLDDNDPSTSYLKSHAAFNGYLQSRKIDAAPYSTGNEISATFTQIVAYGNLLGEYVSPEGTAEGDKPWYEGMTLQEMTISYLNAHINDVGLFGTNHLYDDDPSTVGTEFENTNGFFKIIGIYSTMKVQYPEPMKAAQSILRGIMGDQESLTNICNVYNAWNGLASLMSNVRTYAPLDERDEVLSEVENTLLEYGPEAIINSYNKQKAYQNEDGTFAHGVNSGAETHQGGLPVGLGGKEGNVDANGFGSTSIVNSMFSVFGLSSVPIYTESDWLRFLEILVNLEPVEKIPTGETVTDSGIITFDDEEYFGFSSSSGEIVTVKDKEGKDGKAYLISKATEGGQTVRTYVTGREEEMNVSALQLDVKLDNISRISQCQLAMGSSTKTGLYDMPVLILLTLGGEKNGSKIYYSDFENGKGMGQNIDTGAVVGEWFTIRVEYYEGDAGTLRYKTYINGKHIYTSNHVYGTKLYSGEDRLYSAYGMNYASFAMNSAFIGDFYFDNISLMQYTGELGDGTVGIPGAGTSTPESGPVNTFDTVGVLPSNLSIHNAKEGEYADGEVKYRIEKVDGEGMLVINKRGAVTVSVDQRLTERVSAPTSLEYNVDLTVKNAATNPNMELYLSTANGYAYFIQIIVSGTSSGAKITMRDYGKGTGTGAAIDTGATIGEKINVRIVVSVGEYDNGKSYGAHYDVYINGEYLMTGYRLRAISEEPDITDITSVKLLFNSSGIADFYIDNTSLIQKKD